MEDDTQRSPADPGAGADAAGSVTVSDPAELIRLASMIQALVVETREISLDDAGRKRLHETHRRAVDAIKELVSDKLEDELTELGLPMDDEDGTGPEVRLAQAQLLGWLNGLFQGIQAVMAAQQMSSGQQLRQLQQSSLPGRSSDSAPGGQYL